MSLRKITVGPMVFVPMNGVPNLTMQWWGEDMGPLYPNFAQGMFPRSHSYPSPNR